MKIVSTGATLSSPEYQKKKKKERKRKLIVFSSVVFAVLIATVLLLRLEQIQISQISVEGNEVISDEKAAVVARDALRGNYLGLIPRTNALFYPKSQVKESLSREFPRFSSIEVKLSSINSIKVSVTEREPYALYCSSAERPQDASACFFLDKGGFIFDEAPAFSGTVYFVYASEQYIESSLGQELMLRSEFEEFADFISQLELLGFQPLAALVGKEDLVVVMPEQARLIVKREDEFSGIYSNLEAFLNNESIREQGNFIEKFSELDLRTRNKVRWSLKEQI
ncbi:MAG: hypothetical protein NUV78_02835 [Candidatus Zambryskibacteria bacterium]|nr:hypothetical protein [Candidatus Zambryskibacteria bacterium]